jgi:hypothetical protein
MRSLAEDLVSTGHLAPSDVEAFVATVEESARAGHFRMSLTMFGTLAAVSTPQQQHL